MRLEGFYDLLNEGPSIVVCPSTTKRQYDSSDTMFNKALHLIIMDLGMFDLAFLTNLWEICYENGYMSFSLMDDRINETEIDDFFHIISERTRITNPQVIVSVSIATKYKIPDDCFVGAMKFDDSTVSVQSFNAASLNYSQYKRILPEAQRLADHVTKLILDPVETVIWLDNWFQNNIQYIKDNKTHAFGKTYVCEAVTEEAIVPDVLLRHYGTCEDIASSLATILDLLGIKNTVIQARAHAWILVRINGDNYIWDCTHNITRNPNMAEGALKALSYCCKYTLIGLSKNTEDYYIDSPFVPPVSETDYPRDLIEKTKQELIKKHSIVFCYSNPVYKSYILNK